MEIMLVTGEGCAITPDMLLSESPTGEEIPLPEENISTECESDGPEVGTDKQSVSQAADSTDKSSVSQATDSPDQSSQETADGKSVDTDALYGELYRRFTYRYPHEHLTRLPEKMSVSRTSPNVLDDADGTVLFDDEEEESARVLPRFIEPRAVEESAKRGIATHYLLQFCDLENLRKNGARSELDRLLSLGFITPRDAERVRLSEIEMFRRSRLFSDMLGAKSLYREFRFNTSLPASAFTEDEERRAAYEDRTVLIQGVIDCLVEYPDGSLALFDYKTDRLTREELSDRTLAEEKLRDKHSLQLSYYALAVEKIFGKRPKRVEVYSLPLGDTVDVSRK